MATEMDFVNYKEFVENLPEATEYASGDKAVISNATNGPRQMPDNTAEVIQAQKTLAGNVAPGFDPNRTSGNPYHENDPVVKDGVLYITKNEHYGPWNASNFKAVPSWDANFRTMYKSEFQSSNDDSTIFVVRSNSLEIGWIDNGKNYNHASRCRTKMFIPVKKGDRIVSVPQGKNIVGGYSFYDASKTFVNYIANINNFKDGAGKDVVVAADGFVRLCFYNHIDTSALSNTDYFDGCCAILRSAPCSYVDDSAVGRLGGLGFKDNLVFGESMLEQGAYDTSSGTKIGHTARIRNISPIKVSKGDDLYCVDSSISLMVILLSSSGTVLDYLSSVGRSYKVPADGYLIFHGSTSQTFSKAAFVDKVKLDRYKENLVLISDKNYLVKGYYDDNGALNTHSNRLANYRAIWANRGDEIICNDDNLQCNVRERSIATGTILYTHPWFSSKYNPPGDTTVCKNAVVQNDGVELLITFAPTYGAPNVDIETQQHCVKIIRKSSDLYKAVTEKIVLPVGSKRGHPLSQYLYTGQSGCFVGDNLWVSFDAAGDAHYINVVDVDNDTVLRTMTSELGHDGVQDYCEEKDTLVTVLNNGSSSKIRLIPNASQLTTEIAVSDCIEIDIDFSPGVVCFGENPQILYLSQLRDDSTQTRVDKVRKVFLTVDSNGNYTGVASIVKEYNIVVDWSSLCDFGRNNSMYVQDSAYDGYLYLAIGTSGHNYMVLEKNDDLNVFVAVGRYAYDYYGLDGTKKYLEPELLALKGDRIYCGSRHYNEQLASLVWLQR